MLRIGMLGGMSWESTAEYYRLANEIVRDSIGGLHSADCIVLSVDFADIEALQTAGEWEEAGRVLAEAARSLQAAGAELLVLCTNTMHKVAPAIEGAVTIPFLHVVDVTADAVTAAEMTTVGLLGTAFTMEQPFYRERLARHGIDVVVPNAEDRRVVHDVIYDELCRGIVTEPSRQAYRHVIADLVARGAQGVILGCTEIELLIRPGDVDVPVFPTTRLHIEAAVQHALAAGQPSDDAAREPTAQARQQRLLDPDRGQSAPVEAAGDAFAFAAAAAIAIQLVHAATELSQGESTWVPRNIVLFILPFLAAYFARRRRLDTRGWLTTAAPYVVAALLVNLYPFGPDSTTLMPVVAHLAVASWFAVAYPYMGATLASHTRRMDFVRFTGEWFIYYVLIALGGGVLMGLTTAILEPAGVAVEQIFEWVLPSGAAAGVIVAAWLVESNQRVVGNLAPVLTMLFTPLFAVMLAGAALVYAGNGIGGAFDRELLGVFDVLLVVVLGLVLYGMSARDHAAVPRWTDWVQLVAIISALVLDAMVLATMVQRISDLGFTPNRAVALGLNLLLLVNLVGAAWLGIRFVRGRVALHRLERWQMSYLPVFAVWAAAVVVILPPLFGFS